MISRFGSKFEYLVLMTNLSEKSALAELFKSDGFLISGVGGLNRAQCFEHVRKEPCHCDG